MLFINKIMYICMVTHNKIHSHYKFNNLLVIEMNIYPWLPCVKCQITSILVTSILILFNTFMYLVILSKVSNHSLCVQGDSGGPYYHSQSGAPVLYGIQSATYATCNAPLPGISVNVIHFVPWIRRFSRM
jgi:hypothetical protein